MLINSVNKLGQSFLKLSVKFSSLNQTSKTQQRSKSWILTFLSRFVILKFSVIFLSNESILSMNQSGSLANSKKATHLIAIHFYSVSNFLLVNIPADVFHLTKISSINSFFSWLMYKLMIVAQLFSVLNVESKKLSEKNSSLISFLYCFTM